MNRKLGGEKKVSEAILRKEIRRLRSIETRLKEDPEAFCACGNYYTSRRCIAGPPCDLGHKS